VTAVVKRPECQ